MWLNTQRLRAYTATVDQPWQLVYRDVGSDPVANFYRTGRFIGPHLLRQLQPPMAAAFRRD
jgi:hypothetical protein